MMFSSRSCAWWPLALLALAGGCSETVNRAASFAFERPELVELVCLDPVGVQMEDTGSTRVLPMGCCSPDAPLAPPQSPYARFSDPERPSAAMRSEVCGSEPVLHALVTQSVRGEVASVDLVRNRVLDTNELIPGYNFVDVGGLPAGLVAPPHKPDSPDQGPPWTYVASAEEREVRAVPTCGFRDRQTCGPEEALQNAIQQGEIDISYETLTTVPLPAVPADMLLTGSTDAETGELREPALWVSLPSMGALARIPISRTEDLAETEISDEAEVPFAMGADGPREPEYFGVPTPTAVFPDRDENLTTDRGYELVCGVGYEYEPELVMRPLAPLGSFEGEVQPTRLRFDAATGLLFAADAVLPVVHVFALTAEGGLVARPALPVGAPLRDFAITAEVPAAIPEDLQGLATAQPEDPAPRRYLYGIDRRDGSVMAFLLDISESGASVRPLRAPLEGRYRDRLLVGAIPPEQFVDTAVGIEVIDTRGLSAEACTLSVPSQASAAARTALQDIRDAAGPNQLRGVFVAVITLRGELSIVDVLDLDLACRAAACADNGTDLVSDDDDVEAVAVRRHALRLANVGAPEVDISGNNPLVSNPGCTALEADGQTFSYVAFGNVCVPPDPWNQLAQTWSVSQGGAIPNLALPNAAFAPPEEAPSELSPGQFVMLAPTGVDLCQRGVMDRDELLIISAAPRELSDICPTPSQGTEPTFRIVEAYSDRLVLEAPDGSVEEAERIQACYPDFFNFRIEVNPEQYLVVGGASLYLHRMMAGADGRCVENVELDPRFTSRAVLGDPYVNPYVAFTLSPDWTQRTATVQVSENRLPLIESTFDPSGDFSDALPASVRFFPYVNEVFVVDSARQGLRRFTLSPFQRSTDTIR